MSTKKNAAHEATPKAEEAIAPPHQPQESLSQALQPEPSEPKTVILLRCLLDEQKKTTTLLSAMLPVLQQIQEVVMGLNDLASQECEDVEAIHALVAAQYSSDPSDLDEMRSNEADAPVVATSHCDDENDGEEEEDDEAPVTSLRRAAQSASQTQSYAQNLLASENWLPGEPQPMILPFSPSSLLQTSANKEGKRDEH